MPNHLDTVFSPSLYLDRDKQAIAFIEDRLLHQETSAAVCMYGNGKDYLFTNIVKRFEGRKLEHQLKVLNTVSSDELKDFADMLETETEPTICLVNLRIGKDVSWFIRTIDELRVKRGYSFVSFVCAYAGDVRQALQELARPLAHSLVVLERIAYDDSLHIIDELSERFDFYPTDEQKRDMYHWSFGHVGLLRTLYLLKREKPDVSFTRTGLLHEPTILERLTNILHDVPTEQLRRIQDHKLGFVEKMFYEKLGHLDAHGNLFHPLLIPLIPKATAEQASAFSLTEMRVLDYLREHPDTVVSRDDIAQLVWGEEEWQDKYSDWAIGQLIYRLRKKLEYSAATATIQTRKGQGFVYAAKIVA